MRKSSLLIAVVCFFLCFAVIALYYLTHKPFSPEMALALALAGWRMLLAGGITALAGGLGMKLWSGADQHPLLRMALQAGLGLGVFSLGILIIGGTLGIPTWLWWLLPLVMFILLRRSVLTWLRQAAVLREIWHHSDTFSRCLAVMVSLLFLSQLSIALAPPLQYDSLNYHLVMPHAYLQAGRIEYLPWIAMTGMPQNTEMLHTWAIALGGDEAATTLGWATGLLACLGLLGYLYQRWDARAAWVGVAALLAGYTPVKLLSSGYVEWPVFLAGLGTLTFLEAWRTSGKRSDLLLAGVFTGLAVGNKYPAGVMGLAGLGALAWHAWKMRRSFIPAALKFGLPALAVFLPWMVKNTLATGNPLYPFFFPSGAFTSLRLSVYQALPPWGDWLDLVLLPWRATSLGLDAGEGYNFAPGPLLLGFGLLAWLSRGDPAEARRTSLQNAAALALSGLAVWSVGNQFSGFLIQTRFYISIFPAFAILAAAGEMGLRQIHMPQVRLARIGAALIALVLGLNLLEVSQAVLKQSAPQAVLGLESRETYLANNLGWYQPAMQAILDLPAGSRSLLLYEPRSLYCAPRCAPDEILDRWKRTYPLASVETIRKAWQQEGFTHLLVNRLGVEFLITANDPHHPPQDFESLKAFLIQLPLPIDFGGAYALYSLNP